MAVTTVSGQVASFATSSAVNADQTLAYPGNVTAGDLLWAWAVVGTSGRTVLTPTDSQGNTYTAVSAQLNQGSNSGRLYWAIAGSTGPCTVTFPHPTGGSAFMSGAIMQKTGNPSSSPIGQNGSRNLASVTSISLASALAGVLAGSAVDTFVTDDSSNTAAYTITAGWTIQSAQNNGASVARVAEASQDNVSAGSYNPQWTMSPSASGMIVFTAEVVASGGGPAAPTYPQLEHAVMRGSERGVLLGVR